LVSMNRPRETKVERTRGIVYSHDIDYRT